MNEPGTRLEALSPMGETCRAQVSSVGRARCHPQMQWPCPSFPFPSLPSPGDGILRDELNTTHPSGRAGSCTVRPSPARHPPGGVRVSAALGPRRRPDASTPGPRGRSGEGGAARPTHRTLSGTGPPSHPTAGSHRPPGPPATAGAAAPA
jgi:hypothetical protein